MKRVLVIVLQARLLCDLFQELVDGVLRKRRHQQLGVNLSAY